MHSYVKSFMSDELESTTLNLIEDVYHSCHTSPPVKDRGVICRIYTFKLSCSNHKVNILIHTYKLHTFKCM